MSKEENKSLACKELEEIWTKGNLALVWGPVDRTWALIRPGSRDNGREKMRAHRIHLASIAFELGIVGQLRRIRALTPPANARLNLLRGSSFFSERSQDRGTD
jgi:hypothetical protein